MKHINFFIKVKSNGESVVQTSYLLNNQSCRVTLAEETFYSRAQMFTYPMRSFIAEIVDKESVWHDQL